MKPEAAPTAPQNKTEADKAFLAMTAAGRLDWRTGIPTEWGTFRFLISQTDERRTYYHLQLIQPAEDGASTTCDFTYKAWTPDLLARDGLRWMGPIDEDEMNVLVPFFDTFDGSLSVPNQ